MNPDNVASMPLWLEIKARASKDLWGSTNHLCFMQLQVQEGTTLT